MKQIIYFITENIETMDNREIHFGTMEECIKYYFENEEWFSQYEMVSILKTTIDDDYVLDKWNIDEDFKDSYIRIMYIELDKLVEYYTAQLNEEYGEKFIFRVIEAYEEDRNLKSFYEYVLIRCYLNSDYYDYTLEQYNNCQCDIDLKYSQLFDRELFADMEMWADSTFKIKEC